MDSRSGTTERSGLTRRDVLAITGGVVGLAGCAGDDTDTAPDDNGDDDADSADPDEGADDGSAEGGDDPDPATDDGDDDPDSSGEGDEDESIDDAVDQVLDTYWASFREGDAETVRSLIHEDSPLRDESWWEDDDYWDEFEQGIEVDVDPVDRELVDRSEAEVVVIEEAVVSMPDEPDGVATTEFTVRRADDAWLLYDVEEVAWEEERDADADRVIAIDVSGERAAFLAVEPAAQIDDRHVVETDEGSAIVLDPDGQRMYNENARTRFDAFLVLSNNGTQAIETLVPELTVTDTADDAGHERAIAFLIDDEAVALDGETNLLEEAIDPGESLTVGLELDLMDSGIEDIERGATMTLAFVAE